ncbi:MAG: chromosome segregation protein SMC [Pseudomonadota bacterium]
MRLKQIKLAGFKSFVDPTTVTLPGNRCAVVGPNGCGKSNIIDAVRWVMGESSAKQLRGENITDVIFNGSNSRKPTAVASIELTFDNSDGRIGGEYSAYAEIAIRRQVTRDGQSNYYLNGNKCRRRDIQDIFLGTGFGPRSYSIIEQGMISQLVEAKPEELRVYLEEAAGISKYKERRRETNNRIKHTKENLERINDIREELSRQLDRLQRQAQAAERYRELRKDESLLTAQLFALRHAALHTELHSAETSIRELTISQEKLVAEQRQLEAAIEQSRQVHSGETDRFNEVQATYYQLGAEIARAEEAIQFNQARVKQLELDLQTVQQRGVETDQQLAMDEKQIGELESRINQLVPQVEVLAEKDAGHQQVLADVELAKSRWQASWDEFNKEASESERTAEVAASRIEHLEQLLQRLRRRREELLSLLSKADEVEEGSESVVQLAEEISALEGEGRLLELRIDECLKEMASAREDVLLRERTLDEARNEVQALRHELATLQALQEAALGQHRQEADAWISEHNLLGRERIGESLAVVAGWEIAVETVLGNFLSALQVDDLDQLAASLAQLPDGDLALVEVQAEQNHHLPSSRDGELELPALHSLVRSDGLHTGSLLHGVYAAESTQVAMSKRGLLQAGESIITREGFWVGVDWVRVAHDSDQQAGIIERGQTIETLTVRVEEAERTLGELQQHVQAGRDRVEAFEAERETLQRQVNQLTENLGERRTHHGVTRVKVEEAGARREQLRRENQDINEQLTHEERQLTLSRGQLVAAEQQREVQQGRRTQLNSERENLDAQIEQARATARQSREEYHQLNVEKQSLQSRLAASTTARDRLLAQKQALAEQKESLTAGISTSTMPLPQLQSELEEKLARRLEVESSLTEIRKQLQAAEQETRRLEGQKHQQEQQVEQVREALQSARVSREGLAVQESNILEQLQNTGHTLEQVQADMPEEATEAAWTEELEKMARRIARLGAINLAAIEEYEQESERKIYLDAQAEDLEEALATLLTAIHKIDKETRTRFKDTFEAVNSRLGELFPKVFGGGHAYLELTGEDLLDTGVSLMARPPGKRNASVHLLSGGEKAMTAVALIFAIFHLNPSPVCLLDEVDAPLDDANVSRFAKLIEEMSADVQFLVISHNKITMEMADYLMGVTMQEPGVSRLVSVDVDEAAAMAVM